MREPCWPSQAAERPPSLPSGPARASSYFPQILCNPYFSQSGLPFSCQFPRRAAGGRRFLTIAEQPEPAVLTGPAGGRAAGTWHAAAQIPRVVSPRRSPDWLARAKVPFPPGASEAAPAGSAPGSLFRARREEGRGWGWRVRSFHAPARRRWQQVSHLAHFTGVLGR